MNAFFAETESPMSIFLNYYKVVASGPNIYLMHKSLLILIIVVQKIPVGNKCVTQKHIMDLKALLAVISGTSDSSCASEQSLNYNFNDFNDFQFPC